MKNNLFILFLLLLVSGVKAQKPEDITIFKAMNDEQLRSLQQLALPMMSKPFYISYTVASSRQYSVTASLGAVTNSVELPYSLMGSAELLLGDYNQTSDSRYVGQFLSRKLGNEPDYNAIRKGFWSCSDEAYKLSLEEKAIKKSYLEANPYEHTEGLPDLLPAKAVEKLVEPKPYHIDLPATEKLARELSGIFLKYPEIMGSTLSFQGVDMTFYKLTTEDVIMKQPLAFVELYMQGGVITSSGETVRDSYTHLFPSPQSLPQMEVLKRMVTDFAEGLMRLKKAEPIEEDYAGPVLFEGKAVQSIFHGSLLGEEESMCTYRPSLGAEKVKATLDGRIGKKILDSRLTVKNHSSLSEYQGVPLLGAYEIDAEGVIPEKEVTLVENGILKKLLNGLIPTDKVRYSTGSARFLPARTDIVYFTAPGTLEIAAEKGIKSENVKKALLKMAKEKKLPYAYIVRKWEGEASEIYRVDTKTGEETQVRFGKMTPLTLSKLKNIVEISSEQNVYNFLMRGGVPVSMICPKSFLMGGIEITPLKVQRLRLPVLKFPLQR